MTPLRKIKIDLILQLSTAALEAATAASTSTRATTGGSQRPSQPLRTSTQSSGLLISASPGLTSGLWQEWWPLKKPRAYKAGKIKLE